MPMKIHPFQSDDAPAFRTVCHSSVLQLPHQHTSAEHLNAWALADNDAAPTN